MVTVDIIANIFKSNMYNSLKSPIRKITMICKGNKGNVDRNVTLNELIFLLIKPKMKVPIPQVIAAVNASSSPVPKPRDSIVNIFYSNH